MASNTSTDIYLQLKEDILTLKLAPGESISETEVSARFGVSRTPTRDAFKHLELDNLIKIIPQKGTFVTPINLNKIMNFAYVVAKIEVGIIEDNIDTIDDSLLMQLRLDILKQKNFIYDNTITTGEKAEAFFSWENNYHHRIFRLFNKEEIWSLFFDLMADYSRFYAVCATIYSEDKIISLFEDHERMTQCIELRDIARIKEEYRNHSNKGIATMANVLELKEDYFI